MIKLKITLIVFIAFLTNLNLFGQQDHNIYKLEKQLILGNKKALFEIAPYFDSKKELTEFLGYHIIETNESEVAKRIVNDNCIFTDDEIIVSEKTTAKKFQSFLNQNKDQISFSNLALSFLLKPLEARVVKFDIREISRNKKQELKQISDSLINLDWVKSNQIDLLIKEKNPKALLLIASELYKIRYRFDQYSYNQNQYIYLIRLLTQTEIATENYSNQLTWFIEKEFSSKASLNLLIFFSKNYKDYKWNNEKSIFVNQDLKINHLEKEELLFALLNNKNDSIAKDAFKQLTNCNPETVVKMAEQYQQSQIEYNYALPTFPYSFLKQLVILTEYCKNNNIDYEGSNELKMNLKILDSDLPFSERRKLENQLIEQLTLEEITAFEYLSLLDEESWGLTHSAGRILDMFYSKNWDSLLENEKHLKLYLKKSFIFDGLGIIGVCNNYLKKFKNSDSAIITKLKSIKTEDLDIVKQIKSALKFSVIRLKKPNVRLKKFEGNMDFYIPDLEREIRNVKNDTIENYEDKITEVLSKINYNQIGKALELMENINFSSKRGGKYSFIKDDFGFFWITDFDDKNNRIEFLRIYNQYSEYDFYSYYLNQAGIDYLNEDKSLNYDKIYELLKYDVVTAFVGGGGGKRDNEVYSLIKLLEITYKTTLGYPKKICNSNSIYACSSDDRASEWMWFFIDRNLLKSEHINTVSFNHE